MVTFAELENKNEIEGSYILQLKTKADHYVGVGDTGVHKYRGNEIGSCLIEMVKCYTYGVSTKLKSDLVLKTSSQMNQIFFQHIGFQELEPEENLHNLIIEFDMRTNFTQQGKHKVYHLPHDTKIKHMKVVDSGEISCLSNDDIIFYCTNEEVKCLM